MRGLVFVTAVVFTVDAAAVAGRHAGAPCSTGVPCGAYVCDESSHTCPTHCSSDAQCTPQSFCQAGVCAPRRAIGVSCATDSGCLNGHCVDGLCCATDCTEQCAACNVRGSHGRCVPIKGAPVKGRPGCGDGSVCSGQCDGVHPDACVYPPDTRVCGQAGCSEDAVRSQAHCTGTGTCAPAEVKSCAPYTCDDSPACLTACSADDDCAAGFDCENSACVAKRPTGTPCAAGRTCLSGACSDGVCCDSACSGPCDRCDLADHVGACTIVAKGSAADARGCEHLLCDGTTAACPTSCRSATDCEARFTCESGACVARREKGEACQTSDQCLAGVCVDDVCCNSACEGTCASCRAPDHVGSCTFIAGTPATDRGRCGEDGACAGRCDGTGPACHFPDSATLCGPGTCEAAIAHDPPACDGHGRCAPGSAHDCPTDCDRGQCASRALRSDDSGCAAGGGTGADGLVVVGFTLARRLSRHARDRRKKTSRTPAIGRTAQNTIRDTPAELRQCGGGSPSGQLQPPNPARPEAA